MEKSPIESTRTSLSYFSPNSDIAPAATASSSAITRVSAGAFPRIAALTSSSTRRISSGETGCVWEKSNRKPIRRDQRTLLLHVLAQHLPQSGMQEMRGGMIERNRLAAIPVHLRLDFIAHPQLARLEHPRMRKRRPRSCACRSP